MAVLLSAPILLSITLLISGLAKLGAREGTQDAMRSLRLPRADDARLDRLGAAGDGDRARARDLDPGSAAAGAC
ncbi:hypothetical protein [Brachybacterium sp. GPGPB12]|uniref:hypothetical protein n=1 Tax=Brachybacterium sp. GPGPB12 TaxID=3023517 RepID=UPI003134555A